jgi:hypothetical protein
MIPFQSHYFNGKVIKQRAPGLQTNSRTDGKHHQIAKHQAFFNVIHIEEK